MIPPPALAPRDYMSALYDFLPVLAFFIAFKYAGIYLGTKVLMGATALQLLAKWLHTRVLSKMMVYSCLLVFVFGGATLYFHNDLVIMWMPTVLYVTLAVAFGVSQLWGPTLVERMLGEALSADARTWKLANSSWIVFFLLLAGANLVVVYRYGLNTWVGWKLAKIGIVFLFALLQALWLARRAESRTGEP
ncbi:MAG: inner membrane-spanning protein YciB [Pseudomonadota bacterium]